METLRSEPDHTNITSQPLAAVVGIGTCGVMPGPVALVGEPAHIAAHSCDLDGLAARAATFRGAAHALYGEPRQDSFALAHSDQWLVAVVSDGISSQPWSHVGSAAAAQTVAAAIRQGADPNDGQHLLAVADDACVEAAAGLGVDAHALASTLTVAAVQATSQDDGSHRVLLHSAGDSPALILDTTDGTWSLLTPETGGPTNVVEQFVPGFHHDAFHVGYVLRPGAVLVLASDGFTALLNDNRDGPLGSGPFGQDLAHLWSCGPRDVLQFIVDVSIDAYHDDKTVIAIWNESVPAARSTGRS